MSINLKKLITIYIEELVECQQVLSDLLIFRTINNSTGVQLDGVGDIVGENREGRNDTDYRAAINIRIFVNASSGEPESLILALKEATNATTIYYNEVYPARVQLFSDGDIIPDGLVEAMESVAMGGVAVDIMVNPGIITPLIWADEGGQPNLPGKSWDELGYLPPGGTPVGGQFVELIS